MLTALPAWTLSPAGFGAGIRGPKFPQVAQRDGGLLENLQEKVRTGEFWKGGALNAHGPEPFPASSLQAESCD